MIIYSLGNILPDEVIYENNNLMIKKYINKKQASNIQYTHTGHNNSPMETISIHNALLIADVVQQLSSLFLTY